MAQDFKIVGYLRTPDKGGFGPGDEDKLLDASTPEERENWLERGLLSGDIDTQSQREQAEIAQREEVALGTISAALIVERVSGEPRVDLLERIADKLRAEQDEKFGAVAAEVPQNGDGADSQDAEIPTANGLTKAVNEALIERFGSVEGVAKATDAELLEIKGIADASLPKVRTAYPMA